MFLFGLQHGISSHSQFVAELVLGKIQPNVVFSGAPETLTNRWLPTGSISPRVFYICCLDWVNKPSVQQRCGYFLPCRSKQFSLLPRRIHFSCVSSQVFPFLFVNNARSCVSRMILSAVCTSSFFQAIFLRVVRILSPHFAHICRPIQTSLWYPYFWYLKHLKEAETYFSTISKQ